MYGKDPEDKDRRRLVATTNALGGIAMLGVATALVASMAPSERARSAGTPAEVNGSNRNRYCAT